MNNCIKQKFVRAAICVGFTAAGFVSPATEAVDVLSNINEPYLMGYPFSGDPPIRPGLGFRTGPSRGIMDGLSISLLSGFSNESQTISFDIMLYEAALNGLPEGPAIATDTGVTATWTESVGNDFHQQSFDYGAAELPNLFSITLSSKTRYVLVLADGSGLPVGEQYWSMTNNPYTTSDGYEFMTTSLSFDGGGTWSVIANWNPIARISVIPVPEPSSLILVGLGVVVGGITKRIRRKSGLRHEK